MAGYRPACNLRRIWRSRFLAWPLVGINRKLLDRGGAWGQAPAPVEDLRKGRIITCQNFQGS